MTRTIILILAAMVTSSAAAQTIEWRVENRFRFYKPDTTISVEGVDFSAFGLHEKVFNALASDNGCPDGSCVSVFDVERRLSDQFAPSPDRDLADPRDGRGWAAMTIDNICWDGQKRRHSRCGDAYLVPKQHRVLVQLTEALRSQHGGAACTFSLGTSGGKTEKATTCDATDVLFEVPYPDGGQLTIALGDGSEVADDAIKVKDRLIVSFGDSFSSGEGNPDVPVALSLRDWTSYRQPGVKMLATRAVVDKNGDVNTGSVRNISRCDSSNSSGSWCWKPLIADTTFAGSSARWLQHNCHRSQYGNHFRVALQLALRRKQEAVTYLGYSCSGAQTGGDVRPGDEGILKRYKGVDRLTSKKTTCNKNCSNTLKKSQIELALRELCRKWKTSFSGNTGCDLKRPVDLVLLETGGNDAQFSSLVVKHMVKDSFNPFNFERAFLVRVLKVLRNGSLEKSTKIIDEQLSDVYAFLDTRLRRRLEIDDNRIVLTAYPNILTNQHNAACQSGTTGMDIYEGYQYWPDLAKSAELVRFIERLRTTMEQASKDLNWAFVDEHAYLSGSSNSFIGHGFCAKGADNKDEDFRIPRLEFVTGGAQWSTAASWKPPAHFPYASRHRWVRTPNDVYMAANAHMLSSRTQFPDKLNVIFASLRGGAFHPNAQGHAAIADAILNKIKAENLLAGN